MIPVRATALRSDYMIEKRVETNESLETCLAIITSQPVLPDKNHPSCKIEKYAHAELDLSSSLADFSWKASVPSLEESQDGLMLELPHRV